MKVIKPQRLGVLHRVVEHQRRYTLVVTALVYVPLSAPRRLLTEQQLWMEASEPLGGIVDEGLPKARGEMLVTGVAHAAGARAVMARAKVGPIDKQVAVFGERFWDGSSPSEPAPFDLLPIDWAHAFGGKDFAQNPHGKGIEPIDTPAGKLHVLPNVEDPKRLVVARRDRPAPAGFGALEPQWPQRFEKIGTYDRKWLETLFPGMAADFDVAFYNRALPDQRLPEGFFAGDEEFRLEGMSPEPVAGRLEKLVVRAFVSQKTAQGTELLPIGTRLDTVHFIPHLDRAVLSFRGTHPVAEDDADDVVNLIVAAEDPAAPRAIEHYREVLALRLDRAKGALLALRDEDLMPPASAGWAAKADPGDVGAMVRSDNFALANAARGRKRRWEEARAEIAARGEDPDKYLPPHEEPAPPPDPYDIDANLAALEELDRRTEQGKRELEAKRAQTEADARAKFAAAGKDWDAEQAKAMAEAAGPPTFSADDMLGRMNDLARKAAEQGKPAVALERDLSDPAFAEMLHELEELTREGYRKMAHHRPAASVDGDRALARRALVVAAKDSGESLRERDLTGADLRGLDLCGMDLSGAFLEGADLSGARLCDADLSEAVLARANLRGANLAGAKLRGANLGGARVEDADLSDAALDGAILVAAMLDGARLAGARLHGADFLEARFVSADLSNAEAERLALIKADLRQVTFAGARLRQTQFIAANVDGVDFTGCDLTGSQFLASRGEEACFAGASLDGAVFVAVDAPLDLDGREPRLVPTFARAEFAGASLKTANFRGMDLAGADFSKATLDRADLSKADLRGANLFHARARGAMLMRADLRGANLRGIDLFEALAAKADLRGADLSGSNFARADLSLVRVDGATKIDGALTYHTRVDPRRPIEDANGASGGGNGGNGANGGNETEAVPMAAQELGDGP